MVRALVADVGPISATTVLQNITGLDLPIGASPTEIWVAEYLLIVNGANAVMDAKFGLTVPAGATGKWGGTSPQSGVSGWGLVGTTSTPAPIPTLAQTVLAGTAVGASFGVMLRAIVFGGGTAGPVQIQFAQNVSDPGALKIERGSMMNARRVNA